MQEKTQLDNDLSWTVFCMDQVCCSII